jgi:hypothetical protein
MNPKYIILHHSFTKDSQTVSWGAIRKYHVETLGWRDIGYHYGIENLRGQMEALVGRMWYERGAHCRDAGMNGQSLGVCFVGNFDENEVPKDQWDLGVRLVGSLCLIHGIPVEKIKGHREYSTKTCPGEMFDLTKFRSDVLELVIQKSKRF